MAEGDYVLKGTVLGGLAEPTKYYVTEGPNLYFELQKMESRLIHLIILSDRTLIPDCRQACTDFGFMPFCPRYLQK